MEYPHPIIDPLLRKFEPALGGDYKKYGHHVYRVFSNCLLLDNDIDNEFKYAMAAVFHDIGIWTAHTFDYLAPSIDQARVYLAGSGREALGEEISLMIYWHHKTSAYKGPHEKCVEVFRKADWIDVSLGALTFGANRAQLKKIRKKFPNSGFHLFLLKQTFGNFMKHPLNPLPVFKK